MAKTPKYLCDNPNPHVRRRCKDCIRIYNKLHLERKKATTKARKEAAKALGLDRLPRIKKPRKITTPRPVYRDLMEERIRIKSHMELNPEDKRILTGAITEATKVDLLDEIAAEFSPVLE